MFSKKKFVLFNKINLLIIVLLILLKLLPVTLSRYESNAIGETNTNIAYYLLEPNYYTDNIKLNTLGIQQEPYVYNFTISNFNENDHSEVDLTYILSIVTTTNIPLRYELYENEDYTSTNKTNLITTNNTVIEPDSDGTYFQTITMNEEEMLYSEDITNSYTLLIYYDSNNADSKYQDTIEGVRIIIDSKQEIDSQ